MVQVFSGTSVFPANYSTNFSIMIITRGYHNTPIGGRSTECTHLDSTPHINKKNKKNIAANTASLSKLINKAAP
jgi:hypothetical protein